MNTTLPDTYTEVDNLLKQMAMRRLEIAAMKRDLRGRTREVFRTEPDSHQQRHARYKLMAPLVQAEMATQQIAGHSPPKPTPRFLYRAYLLLAATQQHVARDASTLYDPSILGLIGYIDMDTRYNPHVKDQAEVYRCAWIKQAGLDPHRDARAKMIDNIRALVRMTPERVFGEGKKHLDCFVMPPINRPDGNAFTMFAASDDQSKRYSLYVAVKTPDLLGTAIAKASEVTYSSRQEAEAALQIHWTRQMRDLDIACRDSGLQDKERSKAEEPAAITAAWNSLLNNVRPGMAGLSVKQSNVRVDRLVPTVRGPGHK